MVRNLFLAAAVAAGAFAFTPAPADAGIYIGVGDGYYGHRHHYRPHRVYRPYGYYRPAHRSYGCRSVTRTTNNGYRRVTVTRKVC